MIFAIPIMVDIIINTLLITITPKLGVIYSRIVVVCVCRQVLQSLHLNKVYFRTALLELLLTYCYNQYTKIRCTSPELAVLPDGNQQRYNHYTKIRCNSERRVKPNKITCYYNHYT